MTYAVASRKYNGTNSFNNDDQEENVKKTGEEKIKKIDKIDSGSGDGATLKKDVIKTNVIDDLNNFSKYNVELDNGEDAQRNELNKELSGAIKRHSMATPSKELSNLLNEGNLNVNDSQEINNLENNNNNNVEIIEDNISESDSENATNINENTVNLDDNNEVNNNNVTNIYENDDDQYQ